MSTLSINSQELFAALWRFLQLSVHRHKSGSTGEVLVVMTIALLDHDGYRPTVMDLAGLTGLPKSNVSRYLSSQLKKGYLTEQIDKSDRRRRIYTPTAAGRKEMDFLKRKIAAISSSIGKDSKDLFSVLSKFAAEKT